MGFHPKRALPSFGQSLYRWMSRRGVINAGAPAVILFPDCFTVYNEPHIGRAAVTVLEAFGYRVVLPQIGCCGRTYLSTGLLGQAQRVCRTTATSLIEVVQRENAIAVVACEPSCLSAIKDEWLELDMGMDVAALRELAVKSFLVEQFLEERWAEHLHGPKNEGIEASWQQGIEHAQGELILHGHCHQKALWGVDSSAALLRRVFGERLRVLDSGCCGMAGQFGYQRDHYDLSMKIGEQSLFASLREQPRATVIAPGTSCRQQIHDGMHGRTALHPIEAVLSAIIART
jgi:Fe-S oxidoreductase